MLITTTARVAIASLLANPLRTALSMLGVIIGVAAVIAMLAVGAGARKQILDSLSALGTNLVIVRPGQAGARGVSMGDAQTLTLTDAEAILANVPSLVQVSPIVSGSVQAKYFNRNVRVSLTGAAVTYFPIRNFTLARGRFFNDAETQTSARVAVIGSKTATDLFGRRNPLGEMMKVKGINFRVIGVLIPKGDQGFYNPDEQITVPYTTAMRQVPGLTTLREIDVDLHPQANVDRAMAQMARVLRRTHRLRPGIPDDFNIRSQAEFLQTAATFSQTFSILLSSVAGISLLVGGVGIMNIMLVTVTERTREIGIRKAIGARFQDILLQFLFESILLGGLGGLLGILFGVVGALAIDQLSNFKTILQPWSFFLALGFALTIGIVFGLYPAYQAARLNPIEALRYE